MSMLRWKRGQCNLGLAVLHVNRTQLIEFNFCEAWHLNQLSSTDCIWINWSVFWCSHEEWLKPDFSSNADIDISWSTSVMYFLQYNSTCDWLKMCQACMNKRIVPKNLIGVNLLNGAETLGQFQARLFALLLYREKKLCYKINISHLIESETQRREFLVSKNVGILFSFLFSFFLLFCSSYVKNF